MKTAIIKTGLIILLLFVIGAGCEREDSYDTESIIGNWAWICTCGGFAGCTYPEKEQNITLEFTKDSVFIERENGVNIFESTFCIYGDTLKYYRGTDLEYKIKFFQDTLALYFIVDGYNKYYKRIS